MFGVFVNAHVGEFFGAVWVAQTFHEFGSLSFLTFGLFSGYFLRHTEILRPNGAVKIRQIKCPSVGITGMTGVQSLVAR